MIFNLGALLPVILPKAIAWAEARSAEIAARGESLGASEKSLAKRVAVADPESIRILVVDTLPLPEDSQLRHAALQTGLLGPGMVGLTLGSSIYICRGYRDARLVSHECRHVYQYEQAGSIAAFLSTYLRQIVQHGYTNAPYEVDARLHELHV